MLFIPVKIFIGSPIYQVIHDIVVLFLDFLCLIFKFLSRAQTSLVILLLKYLITRFHIFQTSNLWRLLLRVRINIYDSWITRWFNILRRSNLAIQSSFRIHFPMLFWRCRLQSFLRFWFESSSWWIYIYLWFHLRCLLFLVSFVSLDSLMVLFIGI